MFSLRYGTRLQWENWKARIWLISVGEVTVSQVESTPEWEGKLLDKDQSDGIIVKLYNPPGLIDDLILEPINRGYCGNPDLPALHIMERFSPWPSIEIISLGMSATRLTSQMYLNMHREMKPKIRREDLLASAPTSLFDSTKPLRQLPGLPGTAPFPPTVPSPVIIRSTLQAIKSIYREFEAEPVWIILEDWALHQAVAALQNLPLSLTIIYPWSISNWDMVSDMVNVVCHCFWSGKQCRARYESRVVSREEDRNMYAATPTKKPRQAMKTGAMFETGDREQFCQLSPTGWVATRNTSLKSSTQTEIILPTSTPDPSMKYTDLSTLPSSTCLSSGSCNGQCGGGSAEDCWCNEMCEDRQDCCCDRDQFCSLSSLGWISNNAIDRPPPTLPSLGNGSSPCLAGTCSGRCGGQAGTGCWCDEVCAEAGDCCCDREDMCYSGNQGWMDRNITSTEAPIYTRPQTLPTSTVSSNQDRGSTSSTTSVSAATAVSTSSTEPSIDSNDTAGHDDLDETMIPTTTLPPLCISSGSCVTRCGGGSDSFCWCDTRCTQAGDCCCDREEVCTRTHAGWVNAVKNMSLTFTLSPSSTNSKVSSSWSSSQPTVPTQSSSQSSPSSLSSYFLLLNLLI